MLDTSNIYTRLKEAFDPSQIQVLKKGGQNLDYLTGEAVISRLNDVLGVGGWQFFMLDSGRDEDTYWVHGKMIVELDGKFIIKEQFGECQTNKGMSPGDARKGAATDALKKCATLFGVGLYLSEKTVPAVTNAQSRPAQVSAQTESLVCVECNDQLKDTKFKDGTIWDAAKLASFGNRKFGKTLCMKHYREFTDAAKAATTEIAS